MTFANPALQLLKNRRVRITQHVVDCKLVRFECSCPAIIWGKRNWDLEEKKKRTKQREEEKGKRGSEMKVLHHEEISTVIVAAVQPARFSPPRREARHSHIAITHHDVVLIVPRSTALPLHRRSHGRHAKVKIHDRKKKDLLTRHT